MKFLVTGGAGFLGSHLVDRLLKEGHEVTIFDNLERSGNPNSNAKFIKGDILNNEDINKIEFVDVLVHAAAVCGVEVCIENPKRIIYDFNGTQLLVERAEKIGVKKFVYFSTGEIYGDDTIGAEEKQKPHIWNSHEVRTSYALSKLLGEALVNISSIDTIIIRPFNIYGPRQKGAGVLRNFIERALRGIPLQIYNSGTEIRAMCYIDDFIDGVYKAIMLKQEVKHLTFNLGNSNTSRSVIDLAETVKDISLSDSQIIYIEKLYADKKGVTPSIEYAKKILGYNPKTNLKEGITKTLPWYKELIEKNEV